MTVLQAAGGHGVAQCHAEADPLMARTIAGVLRNAQDGELPLFA
jgi:hypothetical protein